MSKGESELRVCDFVVVKKQTEKATKELTSKSERARSQVYVVWVSRV